MRGLLLVAASGLAREVLAVVRAETSARPVWVLDDKPELRGTTLDGAPVIGGLEEVNEYDDAQLVLCAGHGGARRRLVARLAELGVGEDRYATVVHHSVDVHTGCTVGVGSILLAHVALTADVTVGCHVVAMPHVTLTHDDVVEDCSTLCAGVSLGAGVTVGSGAYVGMNAGVRERLRVGVDATVGMGAVVLSDVPDRETWVGNPARPLRTGDRAAAR